MQLAHEKLNDMTNHEDVDANTLILGLGFLDVFVTYSDLDLPLEKKLYKLINDIYNSAELVISKDLEFNNSNHLVRDFTKGLI